VIVGGHEQVPRRFDGDVRPPGRLNRLTFIHAQSRNFLAARINHQQMGMSGAEPADAELVGRALGGEREAFEAIYCRYQAIVYRFARAMTGSPTKAEDVTQEVFVVLMRDLARYEPQRAGLSTYLYGVARNLTRARLRREQRFVNLDEMSAEGSEPADPDDPSAALARAQNLIRLRKAIVGLPSRYREVVILCDLHELSYAEAAGVIGTPVGTVRSRLHRGRTLLAERFRCRDPHGSRTVAGCDARCLA
jgi:RNA polymerase sigma-70 factor, ECF subfamily